MANSLLRNRQGDFEGANLVGGTVEDADSEEQRPRIERYLLVKEHWRLDEFLVTVRREGQGDVLAVSSQEFSAVIVIGIEREFEADDVGTSGPFCKGDLALRNGEQKIVRDALRGRFAATLFGGSGG